MSFSCNFSTYKGFIQEFICNPRSHQVWAGGHQPSRWHLTPAICPNGSNLVLLQVQNSHPATGSKDFNNLKSNKVLAGGTYRNKAGTICNPNGMKCYVEVIRMQVDNIVTRHLHRGQCIALQDAHFHGKGKKVKSTYLNTV